MSNHGNQPKSRADSVPFVALAAFAVMTFVLCILNSPISVTVGSISLHSTMQVSRAKQWRTGSSYNHPDRITLEEDDDATQGSALQDRDTSRSDAHSAQPGDIAAQVAVEAPSWAELSQGKQDRHVQRCRALTQAECIEDPLCSVYVPEDNHAVLCEVCGHLPCIDEVAVGHSQLYRLGEAQRKHPARIGGYWSSGLPFLDEDAKASRKPLTAGIQLMLTKLNISALQEELAHQGPEMWDPDFQVHENAIIEGRTKNLKTTKPGIQEQILIFSDAMGRIAFQLPWWENYKPLLDPILDQLIGEESKGGIIRLMFAKMSAGAVINKHADVGGYAEHGHRIHVPISLDNNTVDFQSCTPRKTGYRGCFKLHLEEGLAFEMNNRIAHKVSNAGVTPRINLIIDVMRDPSEVRLKEILKGQKCTYLSKAPFFQCESAVTTHE